MITELIKDMLGDELAKKVEEKLKGKGKDGNDIELVCGNNGSYVPIERYEEERNKAESSKKLVVDIVNMVKQYGGSGDVKTIKKELEQTIQNLKTESDNKVIKMQREYMLREKLKENGVIDSDYLIYKQGGIDKFVFNDKNEPVNIENILSAYRKESPHLFLLKKEQVYYSPKKGEETIVNPWAKETFNLTKQGEIFKENQSQARELAAQAGIEI